MPQPPPGQARSPPLRLLPLGRPCEFRGAGGRTGGSWGCKGEGFLYPAEPRPGLGHHRQPAPLLPAAPRQPTCSVPGAPVPLLAWSFALGLRRGHLPPVPSRSPGSALRLDTGKHPRLGRAGVVPKPRAGRRDQWSSRGIEPLTVLPARCSLPRGLRLVTGVCVSSRTQPGWLSGSSAAALPGILVRMELGVPALLSAELC